MTMLEMFKNFLSDERAWDMFVTGQAGTGKTHDLHDLVYFCIEQKIDYVVLAYTHKACSVLYDRMPPDANIATLHSFLKKRPGINVHATKSEHVNIVTQQGTPERPKVIFIDEFSMIGEKDYIDIVAVQDPEYDGDPQIKVVYIGDPYQLPPIKDMQAINPREPYWYKLTEIKRTDNPDLQLVMNNLVRYINGAEPGPISESAHLHRNIDLVKAYSDLDDTTKSESVILAYTNKRVQELNMLIANKTSPTKGDNLFSPTSRTHYQFITELKLEEVTSIATRDGTLAFDTKYKSLEYLVEQAVELGVSFYDVVNLYTNEVETIAISFGHESHKLALQALATEAAQSNKAIEDKHSTQAAHWAKANAQTKLARTRAKAWRDYLTFNDLVYCIDFPYAMTVHKSQGSSYTEVFIDSEDLYKCANTNFNLYLKLMYVAISRARKTVYLSN